MTTIPVVVFHVILIVNRNNNNNNKTFGVEGAHRKRERERETGISEATRPRASLRRGF